jgi:hypothetical protein
MKYKMLIFILLLFSMNLYCQETITTVNSTAINPKGGITSVNPNNATIPELLTVHISGTGTHFAMGTGTEVWFSQASSTIYPMQTTAISNTLISSEIVFSNYHTPGYYDVNTVNQVDGHLVLENGFYLYPNPNPPYLTSISPNSGNIPETLTVTVSGQNTNFTQGTGTVMRFEQGSSTIYPNWVNAVSNNVVQAEFSFDNNDNTGYYDVKTINAFDGELTLDNGFYLYPNPYPPHLVSVEPSSVQAGESLNVEISGQYTHFSQGSGTIVWINQGGYTVFPAGTPTIVSDELISADFFFPEYFPTGFYDVNTDNVPDGHLKLEDAFEVIDTATSIKANSVFEIVNISPNPNNGKFTVSLQLSQPADISMVICDLPGNRLQQIERKSIQSLREKINTNGLSTGIYILKIYAGSDVFVNKIIITR